jgi:hypothetical protein
MGVILLGTAVGLKAQSGPRYEWKLAGKDRHPRAVLFEWGVGLSSPAWHLP